MHENDFGCEAGLRKEFRFQQSNEQVNKQANGNAAHHHIERNHISLLSDCGKAR
jgi:hypothetical protein